MNTISIKTDSRVSNILIGEKLQNLVNYLPTGKSIIITDENILRHYGKSLPPFPIITIGLGEKHKTMETLQGVFKKLIEYEADRSTFIIGIGGGIVCDVAGFAASTFMRGLRFGFVSTTLLSQVDASVGGKNGVNFMDYKNMIGTFSQPEFVICDISMLQTLDKREFRAGFAEIIKAAAIKDASLFRYLEMHYSDALINNSKVIEKLISDSVQIKCDVVEQDEKEKGERRKLNFGHTFAHSLEHLTGMLHGEAVSIGMALAAKLSVKTGMLQESELDRIMNIILHFELPVNIAVDYAGILDAIRKDKKREGDVIQMILLDRIGNSLIYKFTFNQLEKLIYDLH